MFTGIIQSLGRIESVRKTGDWTIRVAADSGFLHDAGIGASIACDGVCLTVIACQPEHFTAQISRETLALTTSKHWHEGMKLNLERALRVGEELGGHLVLGHVDGVAKIVSMIPEQDSLRATFEVPDSFAPYLAVKGSIAVDGVSLTINESSSGRFAVNLVPHTLSSTTLGARKEGDEVNFEIDALARYVGHRLLCAEKQS